MVGKREPNMSRTVAAVAVGALCGACASNDFVSSWQAPDVTPLELAGARVAAVVMMEGEASRRSAERALASELDMHGADGVALHELLPDAAPGDEAAVRAALEDAGVEGVVVMRPVGTRTEVSSTPATYTGPVYGQFWGGYYGFGWGAPYATGVVMGGDIRTDTIVSVETLVYSLRQNKLVWAGQSRATNPTNVDRLVRDMAERTARELERRGLLAG